MLPCREHVSGRAFRPSVYQDPQLITSLPWSWCAALPIHSPATNSSLPFLHSLPSPALMLQVGVGICPRVLAQPFCFKGFRQAD